MEIDLSGLPAITFGPRPKRLKPCKGYWFDSLGFRVLAYMAWPEDAIARTRFIAALASEKMSVLKRAPTPTDWPAGGASIWEAEKADMIRDVYHADFEPSGGLHSVVRANPIEELFRQLQIHSGHWQCVGEQLWICRAIQEHHNDEVTKGASLNKVWHALARVSPWNMNRLQDDWKRYRSVAHLCAAKICLETAVSRMERGGLLGKGNALLKPGSWFGSGLPFLLAVARDYAQWATTFRPYSRSAPLIEPGELWGIPALCPPWTYTLAPGRLSRVVLDALATYKAPQREP